MPDKIMPGGHLDASDAHLDADPRARASFEELVESLDAIVWEMDVSDWTFTYVSRRAEDVLGYPVARWVTEPGFWADVILDPEDREWALEFCASQTREARDHAFEYRARAADGRVVWLHDLVRVVQDDDGRATLLRGVMVDITDKKEAERALRERERDAALSAAVGLAVSGADDLRDTLQRCTEAVVEHLDAAFARVWTLNEREQVLELQASAGMYTHLDGGHARVPVGAFKIGKIAAERSPHLTNDVPNDPRVSDPEWARREGMVSFAGYPLMVEDRVVGVLAIFGRHALAETVLAALQDVADRVALLVEREQTARELSRRERQLAEAQQMASLGSWEWAVGSDMVEWSDDLHSIFGVYVGTPVTFNLYRDLIHEDDRDHVLSTVQRAVDTGEGYQLEHRVVRPDGVVRHIFSQGEVETDRQGRPVRLFGVAQDITERYEASEREYQLAVEKVARREAEAAEHRVTRILESITDAFFALDGGWRFTYVNREAETLLQRSAAKLHGAVIWEAFPEAVDSTFERMYRKAIEEQKTVQFEEYFAPLEAWFEVRAFPADGGLSVYFREVTERKRAEEALEYQNYITRTIANNATSALFLMDEKGRCTFMNPAAEAMIGFTIDEVRDIPLHDAIHHHHPDGRPFPMAECPIDRALPEDFSIRAHEDVFIRKNGEFFPVVCAASPIFQEGVPVGTVIEVRDVTEEKRAEQAIRESEERFRSLVEATAAIVWTTSASGHLTGDQLGWTAFTGQQPEEFDSGGWVAAIHPDDRERTARSWERAVETRSVYEVEHRVRRHDGEYRWMMARGAPVLERDGTVREWVGVHSDITERKEMEAALEAALREVSVERGRLHELFMQAPAFITTLRGSDHVFDMANEPYIHLVGDRDILGKPVAEALPEVVEQGFIDLLDGVLSTGEPFIGNEVPVMLQRSGGELEPRWVNFVYQPIRDAAGTVTGIFVHGVDVTDQVRARKEVEEKADELARLARALERSNRELDQFAYVASHDLKAPLRGIANLSQWIEEDLGSDVPAETQEHLRLLRGRVHRMEGLIDGILQFSRAGRVRDSVQELRLDSLLSDVLDMLAPPDHFTVTVQQSLPSIRTERLPLEQVLMNLIGNAIKYTDNAEPRVEIGVHEAEGGFLEFHVADNGPGIDPEYHERIFGIFQTLHARDQVEGTGIGLSLVRKFVEARGGRVWVESEPGAGATFRFLWPRDVAGETGEPGQNGQAEGVA